MGRATEWPLAYLIITAISGGLIVGLQHRFPGLAPSATLAIAGLVVGLYTAISLCYYYQVSVSEAVGSVVVVE
jgi:hypothetical protein